MKAMKVMVVVQRILAILVGMYGFCLFFSEAEVTAGIGRMLEPIFFGSALIVVSIGWLILTGVEEDFFINRFKGE